jgi:hypothetical protein
MSTIIAAEPADSAVSGFSLYRPTWRWHFFAGLLANPFMLKQISKFAPSNTNRLVRFVPPLRSVFA